MSKTSKRLQSVSISIRVNINEQSRGSHLRERQPSTLRISIADGCGGGRGGVFLQTFLVLVVVGGPAGGGSGVLWES